MLELINNYSISEIISFFVVFCLAIKGTVSFFDWAKERIKKSFSKEEAHIEEIDNIQDELDKEKRNYDTLSETCKDLEATLKEVMLKVNLLIDSDKDAIKSFITEKHHKFCKQEWIDDYSMDCIERRYEHYIEESGNSFVEKLMEELRELPNEPPQE